MNEDNSVLIILKNDSKDAELATKALIDYLSSDFQINILMNNTEDKNNIDLSPAEVLEHMPPKKYKLSLENNSPVSNVQWKQESDKLDLFVTIENGSLKQQDLKTEYAGKRYKKIFIINQDEKSNFEQEIYQNNSDLFNFGEIISIKSTTSENVKNTTQINDETLTSISENMFKYIGEDNLNSKQSTYLLAGIFEATKQFTTKIKSEECLLISAKLIQKGADNQQAASLLNKKNDNQSQNS